MLVLDREVVSCPTSSSQAKKEEFRKKARELLKQAHVKSHSSSSLKDVAKSHSSSSLKDVVIAKAQETPVCSF